jgi:hypothetical protein
MKTLRPCDHLRRALQARYPTLRVTALRCVSEGQRIEFVGTREALLASGVAQECWFPQGKRQARRGFTEFGDTWSLTPVRGGRLALALDLTADRLEGSSARAFQLAADSADIDRRTVR